MFCRNSSGVSFWLQISGGAGGIGRATAWLFARLGAHGFEASRFVVDVREPASVAALFDRVYDEQGRLDCLINSAGSQFPQPAIDFSVNGWNAVINTNLNGGRYWFDGPKKGRVECVIPDMPGYPDNIRRASDGNFWVAMLGMRTPALDVAMTMPGFRRRVAQRVAFEEWIYPNINTGGVVKFDIDGKILKSLWDASGEKHPMHFHARAQGLSLPRRRLQQSERSV